MEQSGEKIKIKQKWRHVLQVFTISDESIFLLIDNVPALKLEAELNACCQKFGDLLDHRVIHDYPSERFAEVHLVKYKRLASSRLAKLKLDDFNFHGSVLHVHYAPELETMEETRQKLETRRREVTFRLWRNAKDLEEYQVHQQEDYRIQTIPSAKEPTLKKKVQHGPRFNPY